MLRLRHAIERASRRRWLGLLVVLCVACLLVLLVLHTFDEHGALEQSALTCMAVLIVSAALRVAGAPAASHRLPAPRHREPRGRGIVVRVVRAKRPPGSIPLRL